MALPAPEAQHPGGSQLRFLLFLLLLLLLLSWPSPGDALALPEQRRSHPESRLDTHELRGRFQDLLSQLHANQSREDSNSEPTPGPTVRILTPEGEWHLGTRLSKHSPSLTRVQAHEAQPSLSPDRSGTGGVQRGQGRSRRCTALGSAGGAAGVLEGWSPGGGTCRNWIRNLMQSLVKTLLVTRDGRLGGREEDSGVWGRGQAGWVSEPESPGTAVGAHTCVPNHSRGQLRLHRENLSQI